MLTLVITFSNRKDRVLLTLHHKLEAKSMYHLVANKIFPWLFTHGHRHQATLRHLHPKGSAYLNQKHPSLWLAGGTSRLTSNSSCLIAASLTCTSKIVKILARLRLTQVLTGVFLKATEANLKRLAAIGPFAPMGNWLNGNIFSIGVACFASFVLVVYSDWMLLIGVTVGSPIWRMWRSLFTRRVADISTRSLSPWPAMI